MGVAFLTVAWLQLGWAVALLTRFSARLVAAGAGLQVACLFGLVFAAGVGWPFGPDAWQPEALTTASLVVMALEVSAVMGAGMLLLGGLRLPSLALPMSVVAVVAVSSLALASPAGHGTGAATAAGHHGGTEAAAEFAATGTGEDHAGGSHDDADGVHDDAEAPHGDVEPHGAAATDASAGSTHAEAPIDHGHGPVDTTPPTAGQQAAADALLAASQANLLRYGDVAAAEADGYKITHDAEGRLLHYGKPDYATDGRTLDPERSESLLYVPLPGGKKMLVGGMFMMPRGEKGPNIGGSLTQWHGHDDLCLDPVQGIAITQLPGGGCPPGSQVGTTGEMMHVWSIPYPGGPFAELDAGQLREAVLDSFGIGEQPA